LKISLCCARFFSTLYSTVAVDLSQSFFPELLMKQDRVPPTLLSSRLLKFVIPEREDWDSLETLSSRRMETSGSKTVTEAGAGEYGATSGTRLRFPLGCHCTIFQARIFRIIRWGEFILNSPLRRKNIFICTDSKAAMGALKADSTTSALVLECRKTPLTLTRTAKVRPTWFPGHSSRVSGEKKRRTG